MNTRTRSTSPLAPLGVIRRLLLASGAACALLAPAAMAQGQAEHEENVIQGDFNRPLNEAGQPADALSTSSSTTTLVEIRDGQKFQLEIRNGTLSAKVNDEPVPAGRVQRQGDRVVIRDEAGKQIHAFTLPRQTMGPATARRFTARGQTDPMGGLGQMAEPAEPPPVMVGITMDTPPADVARFLGLDENSAIQVGRVTEGLPAAKAGVQPGDIIVAIDGAKPANPEKLREVLKAKKAGDKLALEVIRKGEGSKTLTLDLIAFDPAKLSTPFEAVPALPWGENMAQRWEGLARSLRQGVPGEAPEWLRDSLNDLDKQLNELKADPNLQPDALRKRAEDGLAGALDALRRAAEELKQHPELQGLFGDAQGQVFTIPAPPEAPGAPDAPLPPGAQNRSQRGLTFALPGMGGGMVERMQKQADELNQRMEQMNKRMEEMNQRMEQLMKQLEKN
jgi:hypothetical protein